MMNIRKVPLIISITFIFLFSSVFTVYMTMFNHAPPSEIMEANRRALGEMEERSGKTESEAESNSETAQSARAWQKFVDDNGFVGIGDVYNSCDRKDRITIGKAVMLPDATTGGLKVRTFINVTISRKLTEGEFFVDVKYNGKDLYDNHWDFCTMDENQEFRQIFCPYKPGYYTWATDRKIPTYIPKGKYETRAWLNGDNGELLTCGITTFVL